MGAEQIRGGNSASPSQIVAALNRFDNALAVLDSRVSDIVRRTAAVRGPSMAKGADTGKTDGFSVPLASALLGRIMQLEATNETLGNVLADLDLEA